MRPDKWVVKGLSVLRRKLQGAFLEGGAEAILPSYSTNGCYCEADRY